MSQSYRTVEDGNMFSGAFEKFQEIAAYLSCDAGKRLEHGQVETFLDSEGRELLRRLFQGHLDYRAALEPQFESLEGSDKIIRNHHRQGCQKHLETLFGDVVVSRKSYGTAGASSLFALDAALNLPPDKYADGLRRYFAQDVAQMGFEEAMDRVERHTGGHLPKRQSEHVAVAVAQDFEAFYERRQAQGPEVHEGLLVLTTNGKGMVMRRENLRDATRKAAQKASADPQARLTAASKRQRKRMATVASVYTVAPYARSPQAVMDKKNTSRVGPRSTTSGVGPVGHESLKRSSVRFFQNDITDCSNLGHFTK